MGWCKIKLDQRSRRILENDSSRIGLRTELMLVETNGGLNAANSKYLTAEVLIRLLDNKVKFFLLCLKTFLCSDAVNFY